MRRLISEPAEDSFLAGVEGDSVFVEKLVMRFQIDVDSREDELRIV